MVIFRPLVWLAVLSTTAILACKDDPLSLDGTGRLTITVVPYEGAQAEASAASDKVGPEKEEAKAARQTAAAPPLRDLIRVNVNGPEVRTLEFIPNADGSVDVTVNSLLVGVYQVQLLGIDFDLGGELVSEYGINNSVTVLSDQTTNAIISFGSFLPVIDPTLPAQTSEFAFFVDYTAVPTATGYFFELDTDPSFSAPITFPTTETSVIVNAGAPGPNWMRVRAENNRVPALQAKPSDPVLVDVVIDVNPTGDDNTTAPLLGVGPGANGQYSGYNIFPSFDEDWFAVDLVAGATITVDVLTSSLASPPSETATLARNAENAAPSGLDPFLEIYDPFLTRIAFNDDIDLGIIRESRVTDVPIPADGRYYIRVTSFDSASVGHYELFINVNATPVATVTVDPPTATITAGGTVQLTGRTFDAFGVELFGREAFWTTDDVNHATVDVNGLVTGVSESQAAITFSSEGVTAQATITVTFGCSQAITINTSVSGTLDTSDCPALHGTGSNADLYTFAGVAGQTLDIRLQSSAFDTDLYLIDTDGSTVLTSNDDCAGEGGVNSCLLGVSLPSTGTYTLEATSFSPGATGAYTLTLAAPLFGTAHAFGGPASFYSIDPITGAGTLIGAIGFNRVGAMAVHPSTGVYYAAAERSFGATPVLITLNPTTGVGTEVGLTGKSGSVTDMSFRSDGTLYLFDGPAGGYNLHTVNLMTGAATAVGATFLSGDGNAMWFDASDVLYIATTAASTTSLYSVSTLTASTTFVGAFTYIGAGCTSPVMNAADYDPLSGTTYASVRCFGGPSITAFASVDIGTLTINVIGPTVDRIDGVVRRR